MSEYITPKDFLNCPLEERFYYFAEYKKYETVKEKEYCDSCGHFIGYNEREKPVGEPYRFRKASGTYELTVALMNKQIYENVVHSNAIAVRLLKIK